MCVCALGSGFILLLHAAWALVVPGTVIGHRGPEQGGHGCVAEHVPEKAFVSTS